jgi:hypothetical protein
MRKNRLNRMLGEHIGKGGSIRFKYYGEFEVMKKIHIDCKDDLTYIGNSNIDGSPVFVFNYDDIESEVIRDFKKLNIILRKIKLKHYSNKPLSKKEQSILSFFKFFMIAYEIKGLSDYEIREINYSS